MRWLLLLVAGCSNPSGLPNNNNETCTTAVCPAGGRSYKFCSTGAASSCRYVGSDGTTFKCQSCSTCAGAASQIGDWCSTGGGTTTSGTTTSGTTTSGSTTGTMSGSCTFPQQTCGAGKKCVPMFDGSNWGGACTSDGTAGAGQACTIQQSPDTLLDNCRAGLVCDNFYGNFGNACRKVCTSDGECASGERCGDFLFAGAGFGWCAPTCTPFSTAAGNCPTGMDCGETVDDMQSTPSAESGFFLCKKTGGGGPYATCASDADCGVNLWCGFLDSGQTTAGCLPNCDNAHACTQPPADGGTAVSVMCHPLANQPLDAGYCLPQ
jgi:hypothetical protein